MSRAGARCSKARRKCGGMNGSLCTPALVTTDGSLGKARWRTSAILLAGSSSARACCRFEKEHSPPARRSTTNARCMEPIGSGLARASPQSLDFVYAADVDGHRFLAVVRDEHRLKARVPHDLVRPIRRACMNLLLERFIDA